MKKPKTERFDPNKSKRIKPEEIDMGELPEIRAQPRKQASEQEGNQASMLASKHAPSPLLPPDDVIEQIRKAVKDTGRETAYIRFTEQEKEQLSQVVYSMKRAGFKTSENEILRIAVRALLEDHQANGKNSRLVKALEALNA